MRRLMSVLALMALAAAPAFAQSAAQSEEAPAAAPASIALGMIEQADAEGVFVLVHDGHASVRHAGSGLTCHFFDDGEGSNLILFPGLPRGDDVACNTSHERESYTLYATRYAEPTSIDELIADAEAAIRYRFQDTQAYPGTMDIVSEGLPPSRTLEFFVTHNGKRHYTSASVAIVNGWVIKLRFTASAPDDDAARQAELMAGVIFAATLNEIIEQPNLQP